MEQPSKKRKITWVWIVLQINFLSTAPTVQAWISSTTSLAHPNDYLLSASLPKTDGGNGGAKKAYLYSAARNAEDQEEIIVRDCLHFELPEVSDVIMSSFYVNSTSLFKPMLRLGELNRLQQSFPYSDTNHRMIAAVTTARTKDKEIIGFCDIDNRPSVSNVYQYNPRPYLSDLCIDPQWRRKGIARRMVEECERHCVENLKKDSVYIRVERQNKGALSMYLAMGYNEIEHPDDKDGTVAMLMKKLSSTNDSKKGKASTATTAM